MDDDARGLICPMCVHVFGPSAWVSFWVRSEADLPNAVKLLHLPVAIKSECGRFKREFSGATKTVYAKDACCADHPPERAV